MVALMDQRGSRTLCSHPDTPPLPPVPPPAPTPDGSLSGGGRPDRRPARAPFSRGGRRGARAGPWTAVGVGGRECSALSPCAPSRCAGTPSRLHAALKRNEGEVPKGRRDGPPPELLLSAPGTTESPLPGGGGARPRTPDPSTHPSPQSPLLPSPLTVPSPADERESRPSVRRRGRMRSRSCTGTRGWCTWCRRTPRSRRSGSLSCSLRTRSTPWAG